VKKMIDSTAMAAGVDSVRPFMLLRLSFRRLQRRCAPVR
jgi:hypothetical protein